jgi:DNA-directed RNA polymerase specialized sigma subunit
MPQATLKPEDYFMTWKTDPTPENYTQLMKSVQPIINFGIQKSAGGMFDPVIKIEAQALASEAVRSYDPASGALLTTHLVNQLQPLSRLKRDRVHAVSIPDRQQLDSRLINDARSSLFDKFDREPSLPEIADATGLNVKRIKKVIDSQRKLPTSGILGEEKEDANLPSHSATDFFSEAQEFVFMDLNAVDQRLMTEGLGYSAGEVKSVRELAAELDISPATVSRRLNDIVQKVQEMESALTGNRRYG